MDNPAERQKLNQTTETNDSTVAGNSRTSFLHPKGFVPIIVLVLVVLTIAFGGFYLVRSQKFKLKSQNTKIVQQPPQSPSLSPLPSTETANWKTYTDNKSGFSLKYPSEWNILINPDDTNMTFLSPGSINFISNSEPPITPIRVFTIKNTSVEKEIEASKKAAAYQNLKYDTIALNGTVARKISGTINADSSYVKGEFNVDVFIPKGDSVIEIVYLKRLNITESTFDQILSTFKFTDQTQAN